MAVRPGNLRVAVGPAYGLVLGSGTGVHEDFFVGQDVNRSPTESIGYKGFAAGPGVKFSAGYGIMDFDPLLGVLEIGGTMLTDGARTYMGFGLNFGVTPKIPRFEG